MARGRIFDWLLALLLCVGALGCTPNRSLGLKVRNPDGTWRLEPRVIVNDRKVERRLLLDGMRTEERNDVARVEVKLRNQSKKPLEFVYRFTWTDATGYAVPSPGDGWTEGWIEGYSTLAVEGVAPSTKAEEFRLEIQKKQ